MNYVLPTTKLKQYLQHNLFYGEQVRERDADRPSITSALVEPDYNKKWYIDISSWDGGAVQLGVTKSYGCSGVWIKGVDGSVNSRHFVANYTTAVSVGLPRSSYAWLYRDENVRATAQAQAFDTLLNRYPPSSELTPLVDFESTRYQGVQSNPTFYDLRKWLVEWLRLGNPKPIVYSGKYYMDQYGSMPSDIRAMIAGIHIANYSTLTPPLPLGFTEWIYHQFTDKGDAMKLAPNDVNKLELDLNYGHGTTTPPSDTITYPYPGVKRISGIRHGWKFELFISDPDLVRYESVCLSPLESVPSVARRKNATLAFNGGEPKKENGVITGIKDYAVSNGDVCQERLSAVPSLIVFSSGHVTIDYLTRTHVAQALSGLRYLIRGGIIQPYLSGSEPQYTEGHARSIHGVNASGHHMILSSTGVYPNQGLTLKQGAVIMSQYGAIDAFDSGGGGDVTAVMEDVSLIVPENIDPATGQHFARALPQVFLIYAEENTMPSYLEIVGNDGANHRVRSTYSVRGEVVNYPNTNPPIPANITNTDKAKGYTEEEGGKYVYPADVPDAGISGGYLARAGDIWRKVYEVDGIAVSGWTAEIHLRVRQGITITPINTDPVPPPVSPVTHASFEFDLPNKKMKTILERLDGSISIEEDPIA